MLEVILNGQKINVETEMSLADLLENKGIAIGEVAVAVNCEFVPRSKYQDFQLTDACDIEVVEPMQGG